MPNRVDMDRWIQNEDGSYTRQIRGTGHPNSSLGSDNGDYGDDVKITKAAQERADELGLDVSTIQGSGVDGRITIGDVEAAAEPELEEVP
jgi:pyruvate/2-oxoglutarate dehydrogenase complex dihydrolipoamide acyltransferase (E2) component